MTTARLTRLICDEADRIVKLVDRMEVFTDERPIEREPVNIHVVLEHVKRLAQSGFARHIKFVEDYDPSLPPVLANRDQLIQVFLNLVKNAAEAIGESASDGEIALSTAFRPGVRLSLPGSKTRVSLPLEFCVKDNGPGVPDDLMPHLFDPFVTTKPTGSGLGLALVAKIVGDHGGIIECEVATATHDLSRSDADVYWATTPRRAALPEEGSRCLLETFWSPTTMRRSAPCSTRRCRARATKCARPATPRRLWRWVSQGDGDLVITDVVMPDENAFDLLPRIKKAAAGAAGHHHERAEHVHDGDPRLRARRLRISAEAVRPQGADRASSGARCRSRRSAREPAAKPEDFDSIPLVGRSPAMQEIYRVLARLMQTDLTVMITGESGTGKELVARALHDYGKRRSGPFVAINMAAIPRDLIESELFGHEKGAFTGANARSSGRFEQAEGGTLFLDEIGDMPMEAQTRLLRVLQQGEYTTVGGRTPIKTDVRIIAATNKDLRILIQQGLFREDLFFRLNVVPLRLPPLRERIEDVPDLIRHFFAQVEREGLPPKQLDQAALERLKRHRWPGNVRELENLARRLAALYPQETIAAAVIDAELVAARHAWLPTRTPQPTTGSRPRSSAIWHPISRASATSCRRPGLYHRVLREIEHPLLSVTLAATRGNQIRAADLLGRQPQHLAQEDPRSGHSGVPQQRLSSSAHVALRAIRCMRRGRSFLASWCQWPQSEFAPSNCRNSATLWYKSISTVRS